jgi:hypothetical protein
LRGERRCVGLKGAGGVEQRRVAAARGMRNFPWSPAVPSSTRECAASAMPCKSLWR